MVGDARERRRDRLERHITIFIFREGLPGHPGLVTRRGVSGSAVLAPLLRRVARPAPSHDVVEYDGPESTSRRIISSARKEAADIAHDSCRSSKLLFRR